MLQAIKRPGVAIHRRDAVPGVEQCSGHHRADSATSTCEEYNTIS
jgi:hypothetical protein